MKYGRYILEHKIWIVVFTILLGSIEVFLLTFSGSGWLMIYVAVAALFAFLVGTYVEYLQWKKYFSRIDEIYTGLDKKYLLCELMEAGDRQEEKRLKELFYEMEVSMNEMVSGYRRNTQDYKEYVETWVHEIKIPIGAMKMILANHTDADFGQAEEISRMESYVEQALYYARSNDVEKDYLINDVPLQQVVQQVILKRRKALRGINAHMSLHDLEFSVHSDSKWLEFMIGQIVDNSIKYGNKDEFVLEIYGEELENATLLHIKDNGAGIKASELTKVFDKGFTGSNGRKGANSTGIGLYLCKKLCKRLEHDMRISSEEGQGTIVTFVFPHSSMIDMK